MHLRYEYKSRVLHTHMLSVVASQNKASVASTAKAVDGWVDTDPCADGTTGLTSETLFIMTVSEWTDILDNYTRLDLPAKESMPYCEVAITDFVASEANCKTYSNMDPNE